MNLYHVKVGKTTRRGHFDELLSFACNTNNENINDVKSYYREKYKGLEINVFTFEKIENIKIEPSFDFGKELRKEQREISSLKNKIEKLKESKKTERYFATIDSCDFPTDVNDNISKIKRLEKEKREIEKETVEIMNKTIEEVNPNCNWVRSDKGFFQNYGFYSYEMMLKGKLVIEIKEDKD